MSNKKKIEINKEDVKKTLGYRVSKKLLSVSIPILYLISIGFALFRGYTDKMNASVYASLTENMDAFMNKLMIVCLLSAIGIYGLNSFAKAARLKAINNEFNKVFNLALNSKISDINKLTPERISGLVNSVAVMKADIKSYIIDLVKAVIPFAIVVYHIAKISWYAAIIMVLVMGIVIILNLYSDFLFHFDSEKSVMSNEMRGVSTALFMSVPMLKYMNAEAWAQKKLKDAQDEATPAMQSCAKQLYNFGVELLSTIPEIVCMGNAIKMGDVTLATFMGFNLGSIYQMMYLLRGMAEEKSELDGELNSMAELKGDDKAYQDKPAFPDKLILQNVRFYYESDENKKKPFIFNNLVIRKGKKYRFTACSGAGKSSVFKYFAGEMVTDRQPDFRTFYVHQQACLINLVSLRDNITLGNLYVPDGDIVYLLTEMGMGDWLANLPKGLDSIIGVDVTPSGGESSRISLMRAFLHVRNYGPDPLHRVRNTSDLILMDEVTSALDKRTRWLKDDELCTEEKVIKLCEKEFAGCTVAIISHEDETSSAYGFRDIVDYEVRLEVRQNGDREEHIICSAEPVNYEKTRSTALSRVAK